MRIKSNRVYLLSISLGVRRNLFGSETKLDRVGGRSVLKSTKNLRDLPVQPQNNPIREKRLESKVFNIISEYI